MPSVRSLIQITVAVAVLSLILAWVNLLEAPDSHRTGRDTFGTRAWGYRAVFEMLDEIGAPVERRLRPPVPNPEADTVVFLNPDPWICGTEPAYLQSLRDWIEGGGRVVVAVDPAPRPNLTELAASQPPRELPTILESLGLKGVRIQAVGGRGARGWQEEELDISHAESLFDNWNRERSSAQVVVVKCTGTFSAWQDAVRKLSLPREASQRLVWEGDEPVGKISYVSGNEEEHTIAAEFLYGRGKIAVADVGLFENGYLSQTDNSVAAAYLMAPEGRPVVFDEFYHGLGVRGNPLYLLTQPGYAALALGLLLLIGLNSWREAVQLGPPLADELQSRREIGEYITAMGQFFALGKASERFLVGQIRGGVLRELNLDYALPPETRNVDLIVSLMARKDSERAQQVREAFNRADAYLEGRLRVPKAQVLPLMQRLIACL